MVKMMLFIGASFCAIETVLLFLSLKTRQFSYILPTIHTTLFWIVMGVRYFILIPERYTNIFPVPEEIKKIMADFKVNEISTETMFLVTVLFFLIAGTAVQIVRHYRLITLGQVFAINGLAYFAKMVNSVNIKYYTMLGFLSITLWLLIFIAQQIILSAAKNKIIEKKNINYSQDMKNELDSD